MVAPKFPMVDADDRKLLTAVGMILVALVLLAGSVGVAVRLFVLASGL